MDVFAALADPVRRGILQTLAVGPARVVDLSAAYPISRPAISRHLRVLGEVGLVLGEDRGRERHYRLDPRPLAVVASLLASLTVSRRAPMSAAALDALETEVRRTARARRTAPTKRSDSA